MDSPRAVANLEAGSIIRATIIAMTRYRWRLARSLMSDSSQYFLACLTRRRHDHEVRNVGCQRQIPVLGIALQPLSKIRSPSIASSGSLERLARVRLRIFPSSR